MKKKFLIGIIILIIAFFGSLIFFGNQYIQQRQDIHIAEDLTILPDNLDTAIPLIMPEDVVITYEEYGSMAPEDQLVYISLNESYHEISFYQSGKEKKKKKKISITSDDIKKIYQKFRNNGFDSIRVVEQEHINDGGTTKITLSYTHEQNTYTHELRTNSVTTIHNKDSVRWKNLTRFFLDILYH